MNFDHLVGASVVVFAGLIVAMAGDAMAYSAWAGVPLYISGALGLLAGIEVALGGIVLGAIGTWSFERRQRRQRAEADASRASLDAAFRAGLARHRRPSQG